MEKKSKIGAWFEHMAQKLGGALGAEEVVSSQPVEVSDQQSEVSPQSLEKADEPVVEKKAPKEKVVEKVVEEKTSEEKAIEEKQVLCQVLMKRLGELIDDPAMTRGKVLILWIDADQLTFSSYSTEAYKTQILSSLFNDYGFAFTAVECKQGRPEESRKATPIGKSGKVFVEIGETEKKEERPQVATKARICIFGNNGSLKQEAYILSAEDMKKQGIKAYNIGSGETYGYRENHIVIDDDPASPMNEKNKYVSRMHAHIGFSDKIGFFLQVDPDGSKLMGKRTRIRRGDRFIECENPQAKEPLLSGDLIELGKAVILKYTQLND